MVENVGLIIQAHMSSERLPGKVLKKLDGTSVLGHVIERLKRVQNADCIIVATSTLEVDDVIEVESVGFGAIIYRGDDRDVLSRFYHAAKENAISIIARICSDNVFIDPKIISEEIEVFRNNNYDLVTSGKSIPLGLGTEIFSFDNLEKAYYNATTDYEHEHVTPYIYKHGFIHYCEINSEINKYRLTLDTEEDWKFVNEIAKRLDSINCGLDDIAMILENEPHLLKINENVIQRSWNTVLGKESGKITIDDNG